MGRLTLRTLPLAGEASGIIRHFATLERAGMAGAGPTIIEGEG